MSGHWFYSISFTLIAAAFTFAVSPRAAGLQVLLGLVFIAIRFVWPHRNLLLIQMTVQMAVAMLGGCDR